MTTRFLPALITYSVLCSTLQIQASELDVLKDATEKWIQTRNRISEERAKWAVEKDLLKGSLTTLETTEKLLTETNGILELQSSELEEQIDASKLEIATFERTNDFILSKVEEYEKRIQKITRSLPDPLKEEIGPLVRKIPSEGGTTPPLPNRLQNVVAISTLIDEFNNDLTLTHSIRALPDGSVIEVRVLYWGLAGAYASNATGDKAWIIRPAMDEWEWLEEKEDPTLIKQLFEVYDKTIDPTLVSVPYTFYELGDEG